MKNVFFDADLITSILRNHEMKKGCELCGEFHPLSYGGEYYCKSPHHVAHGFTGALSPREKELALLFGAKEEDL